MAQREEQAGTDVDPMSNSSSSGGALGVSRAEDFPEVVQHSDKELHTRVFPDPSETSTRVPAKYDNRQICGLRQGWFIALVVLTIVVIGAAIGGGLGGGLSNRNNHSSKQQVTTLPAASGATPASSSGTLSTSTKTSSTTVPTSTGFAAYDCPRVNNTVYTSNIGGGLQFRRLCAIDWYGEGLNDQYQVLDLGGMIAYSIEACIDQCARDHLIGRSNCSAVSYGANITNSLLRIPAVQGNCFFKDQRSQVDHVDTSGQQEGAYLITG